MKPTQNSVKNGFTIIEVIIVLAISTILLLALLTLFEWHQKVFSLEEATVNTTMDVRNALSNMSLIVAQSSSVIDTYNFSGTDRTSTGTSLVVQAPSVTSSGTIIPATYDYIAYYVNSGSLYQEIIAGSGSVRYSGVRQIADNVQQFLLTYNNGTPSAASTVTINLRTSLAIRTGTVSTEVTNSIFLRNKP